VLLVALLAVGGMTFGGVNETVWLLLALGLNATECTPTTLPTDANEWPAECKKTFPWMVKVMLFAAVLFLLFAQHQTAYAPVLGCQTALDAARAYGAKGDLTNEEHQLVVAAEADPYAVEPRRLLAGFWLGQWLHGDKQGQRSREFTSQMIGDFENWMNQAIKLQPQSAPLLVEAGSGWRSVFTETNLAADGRKAVEFCRRAAELYPTGVVVQFELARTLSATGDSAAAKDAAREALRLDDLRPEAERALGDEQRKLAKRIILGDNQPETEQSAVPLGPPPPPPIGKAR
jgi:tetratricopeptide (TPR) repeat protein